MPKDFSDQKKQLLMSAVSNVAPDKTVDPKTGPREIGGQLY